VVTEIIMVHSQAFVRLGGTSCALRNLCLRGCLTVSDITLLQIANNCAGLTSLSLTYNKKVTDAGIMHFASHVPQLQVPSNLFFSIGEHLKSFYSCCWCQ
jgi:hypothetical protein